MQIVMQIVMGWPEWIAVTLVFFGVISRAMKANGVYGKQDNEYGPAFWATSCFTYPAFNLGILYWGGFFS